MAKTKYEPHPVDTSDISLPAELTPLIDDMCRNVHEVWAATRIAQGWTYGARRDDAAKHHPCLVPYDDLTDEEREALERLRDHDQRDPRGALKDKR